MSTSKSSSSVRNAESVQDLQVKIAMAEIKLPSKRWWHYLLSPWAAVIVLMVIFAWRDARRDSGVELEEHRVRETAQGVQQRMMEERRIKEIVHQRMMEENRTRDAEQDLLQVLRAELELKNAESKQKKKDLMRD